MIFFPISSRRRVRKPEPYFRWRVRLFGSGAVIALVGLYLDRRWIIFLALVVLFAGAVVRVLEERAPSEDDHNRG